MKNPLAKSAVLGGSTGRAPLNSPQGNADGPCLENAPWLREAKPAGYKTVFYSMHSQEKGCFDVDWFTYDYDGPKGP